MKKIMLRHIVFVWFASWVALMFSIYLILGLVHDLWITPRVYSLDIFIWLIYLGVPAMFQMFAIVGLSWCMINIKEGD